MSDVYRRNAKDYLAKLFGLEVTSLQIEFHDDGRVEELWHPYDLKGFDDLINLRGKIKGIARAEGREGPWSKGSIIINSWEVTSLKFLEDRPATVELEFVALYGEETQRLAQAMADDLTCRKVTQK